MLAADLRHTVAALRGGENVSHGLETRRGTRTLQPILFREAKCREA